MLILQVILWVVYGAIHSVLAASNTKQFFQHKMGKYYRFYRLLYNIIGIVLLIGLFVFQYNIQLSRLWQSHFLINSMGIMMVIIGLILVIRALLSYDLGEFTGLYKSKTVLQTNLKTDGLLSYMRHPLYTGLIILSFGLFVADGLPQTLVMALCVSIYIRIGTVFEERKLLREFGTVYEQYRKKTPMLWPKLKSN